MLVLGHLGVSLGAAWALSAASQRWPEGSVARLKEGGPASISGILRPFRWLDFRLLLVGAMLPDLVDKPLGLWLLESAISSGRFLGHTLAFQGLLIVLGLLLWWRHGRVGIWSLGLGSLLHLLEDEMWRDPGTWLWPAYGWAFQRHDTAGWLDMVWGGLFHVPKVYVPEVLGAIILLAFAFTLRRRRRVQAFLRHGSIR